MQGELKMFWFLHFHIFCFRLSILDQLGEDSTWGPAFLMEVHVVELHKDVRIVTKSLYVDKDKITLHDHFYSIKLFSKKMIL